MLKRPLRRRLREIAIEAAIEAENTNAVKDMLAISEFLNQPLILEPEAWLDLEYHLVLASAKRNVDLVRTLLGAKFDPNSSKTTHNDYYYLEALCAAITGGYDERCQLRADRFATEQFDGRHITIQPLSRLELIHALVDSGADVNPVIPSARLYQEPLQWTGVPIHAAIAQGHVELVRYLLSHGALVGSTSATYSAFQILFSEVTNIREPEAVAIAEDLISRGADVNEKFEWQGSMWPETPLTCAARQGNLVLVHLLINSGANQGDKAVLQAVEGHYVQVAESLLDLGIVPADFALTLTKASTAHMYTVIERMISLAKRSADLWNFAYVGSNAEAAQMLLDSEAVPENKKQLEATIEAGIRMNNIALLHQILDIATANQENWDLGSLRGVSLAISLDRIEIVEQLLDFGLPVDFEVFVAALSKKNLPFIKRLMGFVSRSSTPDHSNPNLLPAVELGDPDVLTFIFDLAVSVGFHYVKGNLLDVLCAVIKTENLTLTRICLSHHIWRRTGEFFSWTDGRKLFKCIADTGNVQILELLCQYGAEPFLPDLAQSILSGKYEFVEVVLRDHQKRYPFHVRRASTSALKLAVCCGYMPMISLFLCSGIDYLLVERLDPAVRLPMRTHQYELESALGTAICVDGTPCQPILAMMISKNPDLNSIVKIEWNRELTALIAAIEAKNLPAVELLIQAGADVNLAATYRSQRTPLQAACSVGYFDAVRVLLQLGANPHEPAFYRNGATAMQFAAISGNVGIACLLLEREVDVNEPAARINGRTALEGAAEYGRVAMLQLLLDSGARVDGDRARNCERAIKLAERKGHEKAAHMLKVARQRTLAGQYIEEGS